MNTLPIGNLLGINNRRPDFDLEIPKVGRFLRTAVNVDIDNSGAARRRMGTTLVQAMANAHSLYMHTTADGFLVRGSALYAITLPSYSETLLKILTSDARMSYVHMGSGDHYFSNGVDSGRITEGAYYPMGLPTPAAPALALIGGSLLAGWYQIGVSYSNGITGEEGGVSASSNYELTSTGGLRVTLPAATTGATHINVYLSESNGTVPRLAATVATGTATIDLTTLAAGRPVNGRFEAVLPPGQLFHHNGRLCSYAGNTVYVGLPYRAGYYLPVSGFIPFPDNVTMAVTNQGGTYIAADKTYWVPGDLGDVKDTIRDVLNYGAVPGTAFRLENQTTVGWFSDKGIVVADASGAVDTAMSENVLVAAPGVGVSGVFEDGEFRWVASCGYSMNLSNKAVTTYTGFDFTSIATTYGTKVDGVYSIGAGGLATASIGFGRMNFGTEQMKFMPAVYLGVESDEPMNVRVQCPTAQDFTYQARSSASELRMQRVDPGKGLRANWFDLTVTNTAGSGFKLASVSFAPTQSTRRI